VGQGNALVAARGAERQTVDQLAILGEVKRANRWLDSAFLLIEQLRLLYQLDDPAGAPELLRASLVSEPFRPAAIRQARSQGSASTATGFSPRSGSGSQRGPRGSTRRYGLVSHRSFAFHSATH
jgi:hypothetical protein